MRVISISRFECTAAHDLSDAYADNELLIETNVQMLRHMSRCGACRRHIDEKLEMKHLLRTAARETGAPAAFRQRLNSLLHRVAAE